ncbi:MAG: glycoside hydrolase family 31 protein [Alistipes sp.]|nr:glycoside hydrolase family 31 protein [Alistipes sp.]
MRRRLFIILILLGGCFQTLSAQYQTEIEVLKGEQWWGVFVAGEQQMPLSTPFPQTDLSTWVKSNVAPFLVSSRGRYIWSKIPFKIEFTGESILIDSPMEEVEAVAGGKNLRDAYLICCHKNFPPDEGRLLPSPDFFTLPVYDLRGAMRFEISAEELRGYAQEILDAGYPAGTLILPSGWQSSIGSLSPHPMLYPDFKGLTEALHGMGFKLMLTITPFVSGDGPIYRSFRESDSFVKLSDGRTAMAEWVGGYSAFYDVTQPVVYELLHKQLFVLRDSLGVDGFLFNCEEALPYTRFAHSGAAEYLKSWSRLGLDFPMSQYTISRSVDSVSTSYLHDLQMKRALGWSFLPQAVSNLMTANLLGYSHSTISVDPTQPEDSVQLQPVLLLRAVQLAAVLPVATISMTPWKATDAQIVAQCRAALSLRTKIGTYYNQLMKETARTGEPIIRHLEYEFPRNGFSDCNDQFMIGSKYLVAPLLTESNTRTVRFPKGVWISTKGQRYKGPLVTSVRADEGEILIFESSK